MKKTPIILIIILNLFLCTQLGAQERFFEFIPGWQATSVFEDEGGYNFIGSGVNTYNDIYLKNYLISQLNSTGELTGEFETILDTVGNLEYQISQNKFVRIENDLFVVGHQQYDPNQIVFQGILMKYDDSLSINQFYKYNIDITTQFLTLINPNDSTLVIGGLKSNTVFNGVGVIPILINLDMDGNVRWVQEYPCGSSCIGYLHKLLEAPDGGYVIQIERYLDQPAQWDALQYQQIIKVDVNGVIEWECTVGDSINYAYPGGAIEFADDGNILITYNDSYVHVFPNNQVNDDSTIYLEKINIQNGTSMFIQPILETTALGMYIIHMIPTEDGNLILIGGNALETILIKINQFGTLIWLRTIDPFENTELIFPYCITSTIDGGYICAGEYRGFFDEQFFQSAFALKVDEYGCLEPGCQLTDDIDQTDDVNASRLKVFPNPSSGNFTIYLPERKKGEITVMDVTGKIVLTKQVSNEQAIPIDISRNVSGLYLVQFTSNKGDIYQIKIIKK